MRALEHLSVQHFRHIEADNRVHTRKCQSRKDCSLCRRDLERGFFVSIALVLLAAVLLCGGSTKLGPKEVGQPPLVLGNSAPR